MQTATKIKYKMNLNPIFVEKIIKSKLNYIIIFIPFLLITGPFLPDLILTISSIYFLICALIYREFSLFKKFYFTKINNL